MLAFQNWPLIRRGDAGAEKRVPRREARHFSENAGAERDEGGVVDAAVLLVSEPAGECQQ